MLAKLTDSLFVDPTQIQFLELKPAAQPATEAEAGSLLFERISARNQGKPVPKFVAVVRVTVGGQCREVRFTECTAEEADAAANKLYQGIITAANRR